MKKVFNWLKINDRFWWILIISITLAVIMALYFLLCNDIILLHSFLFV